MTARLARLRRLVQLQTKQHEQATVQVRGAQATLVRIEVAQDLAHEQRRNASDTCSSALLQCDRDSWLLGVADAALAREQLKQLAPHAENARAAVESCREEERGARVRRRQVETILQHASREQAVQAGRLEQMRMEELARMMRAVRR